MIFQIIPINFTKQEDYFVVCAFKKKKNFATLDETIASDHLSSNGTPNNKDLPLHNLIVLV